MLSLCPFDISAGIGAFAIGLSQISSFFSSHTDTTMTYCQSITHILIIIWVRCIPLSLRSKIRRGATWIRRDCQLRTSLYDKLDYLNFLRSTIPSSPAYGVFISHSPYGMSGLAPLMIVLFFGRRDFHVSSSDRNMSGNVT